ncbi:unnamed protein product [Sphagnum tenellum]
MVLLVSSDGYLSFCQGAAVCTELISLPECKVTCFCARSLASGDGCLSCCPDAAVWTELISLCQCKVTCFW